MFVEIITSSPSITENDEHILPFLGELIIPIIPLPPLLVTLYSLFKVFLPYPFSVIDKTNLSSDFESFFVFSLFAIERETISSLGDNSIPLIPLDDLPLNIRSFFDSNLMHLHPIDYRKYNHFMP